MKNLAIFAFTLLFMPAFAFAKTNLDIPYGNHVEEKLDIYAPNNASNAPVMVYVHGGGWTIGKKSRVGNKPHAFNSHGYILVSVEYPMLPDHAVEQQAVSVAKAISWVHQNIKTYNGNPSRIHIMGHSAGAHLVALVATAPQYLKAYGKHAEIIQSVTPIDTAALNVPYRMTQTEFEKPIIRRMFHNAFGQDKSRWVSLSPYHQISSHKNIPPFHILSANRTSAQHAANEFIEKLKVSGITGKHSHFSNHTHKSINQDAGQIDSAVFKSILDFIN